MNDYYILLGLNRKEVSIMKIKENEKGIIEVELENKKEKTRCPNCNKFTSNVHSKLKPIQSIYLDSCGQSVNLIIHKKRYHCYKCGKIFTETLDLNTKDGNISNKVKIQIRKDLLEYNLSLKYIADKNRVNRSTVEHELLEATSTIPEHIRNLPRVISFDEFKADTREGKYAFILNDPMHKKVLDILPNRKKEYLIQYFTYCNNRHSVEFVISDMYEPYLLVQEIMFPRAKYVVDRFHYITYVMDAVDKIRIRHQKEKGEKSREYKLLKNKKNVSLLRKYSKDINWWSYTQRYKNGHMVEILTIDVRDELLGLYDDLRKGYYLKEDFLYIVNNSTYEVVEEDLTHWITKCIESNIPEFIEAAGTISRWKEYIINSFIDKRYSNGFTEGVNNKIKVIKRISFGYKSFKLFRARILYIFNKKLGGGNSNGTNNK